MSMLPSEIDDDEILYRAFPNSPSVWKSNLKTFSSAIFKDSFGVSVDREGNRTELEVIGNFSDRFPGRGIASVFAGDCRRVGAEPVAKPEKDNIYHAEIHDISGNIILRGNKPKKLKEYTKLVKPPSTNGES